MGSAAPPHNGMHPTADTLVVIFGKGAWRRVMPGVRSLRFAGRTNFDVEGGMLT